MIKNFIYLDEDKMYSLSSQIFKGITEYLVSTDSNENGKEDTQKGELGSGRILADILKQSYKTEEKKYLHDYSYTIFEKELIDTDRVVDINTCDKDNFIHNITEKSFVKIKGKIVFNDIGHLSSVMKDFNKMGLALAGMNVRDGSTDKHVNVKKFAKENGLSLNENFINDLTYLLDFGFDNQLEIQLEYNNHLFSTNIKRDYLRENENLLIKKYARKTEKEFTIFGIVTQYGNKDGSENIEKKSNGSEHLKVALMDVVSKFSDIELTFTGKLENEIMIDPIAIYTEL